MDDLMVKSVDVLGNAIMAVKNEDGYIYAGISYFCAALGMSRGQKNRQVANVQADETLKQGCIKLGAGVIDEGNEAVALRIDFIPIWLAKISITKKTRGERPEFAKKLLDYQLKAKDILAAAFLPNQDVPPLTLKEQIQTIAQGTAELYEKVEKVTADVDGVKLEVEAIKNDLPILPIEADEITKAVRRRGVEVLGGKNSPAYNDRGLRQRIYNNLYANLKYNFAGIRSYKAIRRKDTEKAIKIVNEYRPPLYLADQITQANTQQTLEI